MKTKVTLKVKHLVMILISIFILLPLTSMFLLPQVELAIAKHKLTNGETGGKVQILEALESKISPSQKHRIIQDYILNSHGLEQYDIYVGPTMTSSGYSEESVAFNIEETRTYLEEYVEKAPVDFHLKSATEKLAYDALNQGNIDQAASIYEKSIERTRNTNNDYIIHELQLSYTALLIRENELDKAEKHLKIIAKEIPDDEAYYIAEVAKYYAEIMLRQGNHEKALAEIESAMKNYEEAWKVEEHDEAIEQSAVYEQLTFLKRQLAYTSNRSSGFITTVSGKVTREDGTPVTNAGIYLRDASIVNSTITSDEPYNYQLKTDEQGNYEIKGVLPGNYQMFAGFMFDDVDGFTWPVDMSDWIVVDGTEDISYDITLAPLIEVKSPVNEKVITEDNIQFIWEEVEEADYYTLSFQVEEEGGSYGFGLDMRINDAEVTLPIETLYDLSSNLILSKEETRQDYFNPATFLGFANPEGKFSWYVQAYDSKGNVLTQSNGYRLNQGTIGNVPIIYLKERELIEADELLLDGKLEAALATYKENVKEEKEELHSLRMITKLIGIEGDGTFETVEELQNPYIEKLANLTENPSYIFQMMHYYYDRKDWKKYQDWYEFYRKVQGDAADPYGKVIHANALMYQDNLAEATTLHKDALGEGNDHRFIGNLLALEIYQDTEIDEVLELAKEFPYIEANYQNGSSADWYILLINLQNELKEDPHPIKELKEGLIFYFSDEIENLESWKETTDSSVFVKFIKALENQ